MLDPTPITRRFHGSSLAAALLGSAAYFTWPDQTASFGWVAAAYGAAFFASLKALSAFVAGMQLVLHRQLKRRAKQAAQKHHPAKWASDKELKEAGMFEPNGRPLGETLSGIPIFEPATSVHSKIVAPPGMIQPPFHRTPKRFRFWP